MGIECEEFSPEWFDQSSAAWMLNKKKLTNCTYAYVCSHSITRNRSCKNAVVKGTDKCHEHAVTGIYRHLRSGRLAKGL